MSHRHSRVVIGRSDPCRNRHGVLPSGSTDRVDASNVAQRIRIENRDSRNGNIVTEFGIYCPKGRILEGHTLNQNVFAIVSLKKRRSEKVFVNRSFIVRLIYDSFVLLGPHFLVFRFRNWTFCIFDSVDFIPPRFSLSVDYASSFDGDIFDVFGIK